MSENSETLLGNIEMITHHLVRSTRPLRGFFFPLAALARALFAVFFEVCGKRFYSYVFEGLDQLGKLNSARRVVK